MKENSFELMMVSNMHDFTGRSDGVCQRCRGAVAFTGIAYLTFFKFIFFGLPSHVI
jgi:hypothetical protein